MMLMKHPCTVLDAFYDSTTFDHYYDLFSLQVFKKCDDFFFKITENCDEFFFK